MHFDMARKTPPSFDFFPDDFIGGVAHFNATQRGIYISLLCFQWGAGSVPSDAREQQRIAQCFGSEWDRESPAVLAKFDSGEDGNLRNPRLEMIRDEQVSRREKRVSAGRKGGKAKSSNARVLLQANGKQKPSKGKEEGGRRKEEGNKEKKASEFFGLNLPKSLDCEGFREVWAEWCNHRTEIGKKLTETSVKRQLAFFETWGLSRTVEAIQHTIRNGWQGIREPDQAMASSGNTGKDLRI